MKRAYNLPRSFPKVRLIFILILGLSGSFIQTSKAEPISNEISGQKIHPMPSVKRSAQPSTPKRSLFLSATSWEIGAIVPFKRSRKAKKQLPWRGREKVGLYPFRLDQSFSWQPHQSFRLDLGGRATFDQYVPLASPVLTEQIGLTELKLTWIPSTLHIPALSIGLLRIPYGLIHSTRRWGSLMRLDPLWSNQVSPLDRLGTGVQLSSAFVPLNGLTHPLSFISSSNFNLSPSRLDSPLDSKPKNQQGHWFYQITGFIPSEPTWANQKADQWVMWLRGGYWVSQSLIEFQTQFASLNAPTSDSKLSLFSLHGFTPLVKGKRPLLYRGEISFRNWHHTTTPLEQAQFSLTQQDGSGLTTHHHLEWHLHPYVSTLLGYSWQDPHLDFAYDTRHRLSVELTIHLPPYIQLLTLYRHQWSASQNRWDFESDEMLFVLRGDLLWK